MDEKVKIGEGIIGLKQKLRKVVFEEFKITVSDIQTIEHYYKTQASLDKQICNLMGWEWQVPKESTEVKH